MTAARMAPQQRRRRLRLGEAYLLLCAVVAGLTMVRFHPFDLTLFAMTLPLSTLGLALWVPVLVAFTDGLEYEGWPWRLAFAVSWVLLAWVQVVVVRAIARRWSRRRAAEESPA